jgi:hypothetical protein
MHEHEELRHYSDGDSIAIIQCDKVHRIDPTGCGCTDCITGYSVPLDRATHSDIFQFLTDQTVGDATSAYDGCEVTVKFGDTRFTFNTSRFHIGDQTVLVPLDPN